MASPGNDHRLGANEAPPAIISMFLGDELTEILEAIENSTDYSQKDKTEMKVGVHILPRFPKDTTDRNRTSPFAFTGNKFEFRMLGSKSSISGPNIVLNTIVAEELSQFADVLEKAGDFNAALNDLIRATIREHKRIIFNGNNYSDEWVAEAERRGLLNLKSTVDALPYYISEKNQTLFTKHKIYTATEIHSRYEILLENYCKTISIEALTMLDMVNKDIFPAVCRYMDALSATVLHKAGVSSAISSKAEEARLKKLSALCDQLYQANEALSEAMRKVPCGCDVKAQADYYKDTVIDLMQRLRTPADELEALTGKAYWPYPTYSQMLFSV